MKAIACITKDRGLGLKGNLLIKSKTDMKFFRDTTINKVVVMGRNTFESIGKKPLKDRVNIVISSKKLDIDGIIQYFDLNTFLSSEYNNDNTFVIGGGKLYKDLLPFIDTIFLTEVDLIKEADTFFPDISGMFIKKSSNKVIENDIVLDFCKYVRRN